MSYTYNSLQQHPKGLVGKYYNDPTATTHWTGTPVMQRTESPINFAWGAGARPTGTR